MDYKLKVMVYRVWSSLVVSLLKITLLIWLQTLTMKTSSCNVLEFFTAGKKQAEKTAEDNQNFETFETR